MGGLAGFIDLPGPTELLDETLGRMLRSLQAEPWYDLSGRIVNDAALGRASLGVFNRGAQPASDAAAQVWVLLDGVLDNHCAGMAAGESQAQWLAQQYAADEGRFLANLNGTFNLVVWDSLARKLTIVNDRFGSRPLYYSRPQGGLSFASEIKALLEVPGARRAADLEAVIEFFTLRHPLGDKTPFCGIRWLPPASILTYQNGRLELRTYWIPPFAEPTQSNGHRALESYAAEMLELLRQAMRRFASHTLPAGVLLSGGLDSRLLVGAAARDQPLHTFTRGIPGCDDVRLAERVARWAGTVHHFMPVAPDFLVHLARRGVWLTDGLMSCIDFYALATVAPVKQHVSVVSFGLGAGALSGLGLSPALAGLDAEGLADRLYASRAVVIPDALQPVLLSPTFFQSIKGAARRNLGRLFRDFCPPGPSEIQAQHYMLCQYNPRSAMHGPVLTRSLVETCLPFADADVLDATCRVPSALRQNRQLQIEVLRQASRELASIPWQYSGLPAIDSTPRRVRVQRAIYRLQRELSWHSRGLIPSPRRREQADWAGWFRTSLRAWLEDLLLSERTLSRGYFNPAGLRQVIEAHMRGQRDHSLQFGPLLTFELCHRLFIDGEAP
jgi:asparagine synthase (glutamine-hydrolysing)